MCLLSCNLVEFLINYRVLTFGVILPNQQVLLFSEVVKRADWIWKFYHFVYLPSSWFLLRNKSHPCPVHIVATVACWCWHKINNSWCNCFIGITPVHLSSQKDVFKPSPTSTLVLWYSIGHKFLISLQTVHLYGVLTILVIHLSSIPCFVVRTSFQSIFSSFTNFYNHFIIRLWFCFLRFLMPRILYSYTQSFLIFN